MTSVLPLLAACHGPPTAPAGGYATIDLPFTRLTVPDGSCVLDRVDADVGFLGHGTLTIQDGGANVVLAWTQAGGGVSNLERVDPCEASPASCPDTGRWQPVWGVGTLLTDNAWATSYAADTLYVFYRFATTEDDFSAGTETPLLYFEVVPPDAYKEQLWMDPRGSTGGGTAACANQPLPSR